MRVVLLCHAATDATRRAAFAGDEPVPPEELARVAAGGEVADGGSAADGGVAAGGEVAAGRGSARPVPRADRVCRAPSLRCGQTAEALGLDATPDDRLAGCDFGAWTGRTLEDVLAADPAGVTTWLDDPAATPHGGESLVRVLKRAGRWLDDRAGERAVLAVVDATVIRALVVHALGAGPRSMWRVDISPLSRTVLVGEPGRWSLRELVR
ncbi:MAG TPA: histidine phosphatase family protein [Pseudonocardia sp.]|jgi:broad specificity phosphatase PhoE